MDRRVPRLSLAVLLLSTIEEPIEQVPYDAPRPGRPLKLDDDEREQLFEDLQNLPTERGYEQQAWSPKLLLARVKDEYDVEYSKGHARKLLGKAGLSSRTDPDRGTDCAHKFATVCIVDPSVRFTLGWVALDGDKTDELADVVPK